MALLSVPFRNFEGGLNTRHGPFDLDSSESPDLLNVTLTQRGSLKSRQGYELFGALLPDSVDHIRNWYPASGNLNLMASVNGDIYKFDGAGTGSLLFNGTAGTTWCFEQALDVAGAQQLWALNGVDAPKLISTTFAVAAWGNAPAGSMCRLWKNRMCVAGVAATSQRLFFSDVGNPNAPAGSFGTNWVDIKSTEDDLDPITWLEVVGDYLVVFKRRSVWVVDDPVTFSNRRIGAPGCESRFQSCVVDGRIYFFSRSGVYSTDGVEAPQEESYRIGNFLDENLNYALVSKVRLAASRDRRIFLSVPLGDSAINTHLFEGLVALRARIREGEEPQMPWVLHDLAVTSMATFRISDRDQFVAGLSLTGPEPPPWGLVKLFEGDSDEGQPIKAHWQTPWVALKPEEPFERLRRLNIEIAGRVVVEVMQDFSSSVKFSDVIEVPGASDVVWDGGVWDGDTWDPPSGVALARIRPEARGRYHSLKFSNALLNTKFTLYAVELMIRGGKEH